ncbi:MAG TPA: ABC transporter ATP-binding protein, partial [Acidimicrobiales bacterium]
IGLDPHADHAALVARIGVMLQDGGIHPAARVGELARHAAALYPTPADPGALLDRLDLTPLERRTFRQLSGGEQRRVALALALVGRPQVVFLDEPTAGVDPAGRQQIRAIVDELRRDGVTVLLSTHDLDEAERVADRVVIIDHGRLVAAGTLDELTGDGGDGHLSFRAPTGLDVAALSAHLGVAVAEPRPNEYTVAAASTPRLVAALTAWLAEQDLALSDLRTGRPSLEDVFVRRTSSGTDPEPAPETGTGLPVSGAGSTDAPDTEQEGAP